MSEVKVVMIKVDSMDVLYLEWSSDVPVSTKNKCYRTKIAVSFKVEVHYCDCTCKAGKYNEEKKSSEIHDKTCYVLM